MNDLIGIFPIAGHQLNEHQLEGLRKGQVFREMEQTTLRVQSSTRCYREKPGYIPAREVV